MASAGVCHEVPNGMPARLFDVKLQIWLRFPAHEDSSERTLALGFLFQLLPRQKFLIGFDVSGAAWPWARACAVVPRRAIPIVACPSITGHTSKLSPFRSVTWAADRVSGFQALLAPPLGSWDDVIRFKPEIRLPFSTAICAAKF